MFCHKCGVELDDNAKFCNKCGTKLDGEESTRRQTVPQNEISNGDFAQKVIFLFQKYFIDVLKNKYAKSNGRATRAEYWYFALFQVLIYFGLFIIFAMFSRHPEVPANILSLALLIPSIAIGVRRLHDINMSGWLMLLILIPIVGAIILLLLFIQPSKANSKY